MLTFQDFYPQKNETLENSNADKAKWNEAFVSIDNIFRLFYITTIKLKQTGVMVIDENNTENRGSPERATLVSESGLTNHFTIDNVLTC